MHLDHTDQGIHRESELFEIAEQANKLVDLWKVEQRFCELIDIERIFCLGRDDTCSCGYSIEHEVVK